ncbi:hypothetical protein KW791_01385 [Candidatus Parcubacteria bacterium]|nr:hypothetical protein [Candidatus Parcubacteria bacterium]
MTYSSPDHGSFTVLVYHSRGRERLQNQDFQSAITAARGAKDAYDFEGDSSAVMGIWVLTGKRNVFWIRPTINGFVEDALDISIMRQAQSHHAV